MAPRRLHPRQHADSASQDVSLALVFANSETASFETTIRPTAPSAAGLLNGVFRMVDSPSNNWRLNGGLASLVLFLGNRRPGRIGVEAFHLLELIQGLRSKILLVDYAVVADHEGPHTRYVVLSGRGDKCEAADHDSLHHKIDFTERRLTALSFQDLEKIPMVRFRAKGIALFNCSGDVFTDRTAPRAIGVLPR